MSGRLWTEEEDRFLAEHYPTKGREYCQKHLNRTVQSIKNRVKKKHIYRINGPTDLKSPEQYIKEAADLGYEVLGDYINNNTEILHKHIQCGKTRLARPRAILSNYPCITCSKEDNVPTYVYLLYFSDIDLYKIGISVNIDQRRASLGYKNSIVAKNLLNTKSEAYNLEQTILTEFSSNLTNTYKLNSGNTETLKLTNAEANIIKHCILENTYTNKCSR